MANEKYNIYAWVNNEWVQVNDDLDSYTKNETNTLLAAKADANGVYTKTEVDNILGSYYTKTEVDGLLDDKADSSTVTTLSGQVNTNTGDISTINTALSNIYTKSEADSAISTAVSGKANSADVYTKTETESVINTALTNMDLVKVVSSLPESDIVSNKLYLVANSKNQEGNVYDIYIYVNNKWEKVDSVELNVADFASASDMTQAKSDISDLKSNKANSSDVYTKTETDNLLGAKADSTSVYAKTETYSSSEVDTAISTAISSKANSSDVYAKTETYSSSEVDSAISTAVGNHVITEVVTSLPATGEKTKLYLVPVNSGE